MATKSKKIEYAEGGVASEPINDVAKLISAVNAWSKPEFKDVAEAERRIGEYFDLCALKGEMPLFETLCKYLGISDDKGMQYARGEGCSSKLAQMMQNALTTMKAVEGKAVYAGMIRDVPYIWRSKQYFGYREPNSKIEDLLAQSLLKDLPNPQMVAQKYLADFEESEVDDDSTGTD